MKKYEIMYIINPTILEEGRDAVSEKWGERKLAYPIDKKKTGFYVLATFDIDGTQLSAVEGKLNITEEVMRYIIVKQD